MTGETAITVAIAVVAALWLAMVGDKAITQFVFDQLHTTAPIRGDGQ